MQEAILLLHGSLRSIEEGYLEMAKATMDTTERIKKAIRSIDELEIMGETNMCIVAFKSSKIDVFMLADVLNKKGWHFERQQLPPTLHFTINYIHKDVVDEFVDDLKTSVAELREKRLQQMGNKLQSSLVKGLSSLLLRGLLQNYNRIPNQI